MKKYEKGMTSRKVIIAAVLVFLVFLSVALTNTRTDTDIPWASAKRQAIAIEVNTAGSLKAARAITIGSSLPGDSGKIVWIIEDGSKVKAGKALVRFESSKFTEELKQLSAQAAAQRAVVEALEQAVSWEKSQADRLVNTAGYDLKVAEMELEQLQKGDGPLELAKKEENLNKARQKFSNLKGYLEDLKNLLKQGYVDQVEVSKAELELKAAVLEIDVAKRKYDSFRKYIFPAKIQKKKAEVERKRHALEETRRAAGFKIGQAEAKLKEARKLLEHLKEKCAAAKRRLEDTEIKAPQDGIVVLAERYYDGQLRKPRVGDRAWQGQPLIYLPDLDRLEVQANVRELDLHNLTEGQEAAVFIDAFPELVFKGKVRNIGTMAEIGREGSNAGKFFSVRISMDGRDQRLRPGMTARVKIFGKKKEDVITIPIAALFGARGHYFCFMRDGSHWQKTKVYPGLMGASEVEIIKGLKQGDMVALVNPEESST